jgi:hypothetical protein
MLKRFVQQTAGNENGKEKRGQFIRPRFVP